MRHMGKMYVFICMYSIVSLFRRILMRNQRGINYRRKRHIGQYGVLLIPRRQRKTNKSIVRKSFCVAFSWSGHVVKPRRCDLWCESTKLC